VLDAAGEGGGEEKGGEGAARSCGHRGGDHTNREELLRAVILSAAKDLASTDEHGDFGARSFGR
jgi:hypothetical protein